MIGTQHHLLHSRLDAVWTALCRAKIRVLVRNAQQAVTGYGSYVTPVTGDVGNEVRHRHSDVSSGEVVHTAGR